MYSQILLMGNNLTHIFEGFIKITDVFHVKVIAVLKHLLMQTPAHSG